MNEAVDYACYWACRAEDVEKLNEQRENVDVHVDYQCVLKYAS
jgi:hypothetical protein